MSEHLRYLSRHARIAAVRACPTPGCPMLGADGAALPAHPGGAGRRARRASSASSGSALVGGCCGTTPEHLRAGRRARSRGRAPAPRDPRPSRASRRSTSRCRSARTPSYLIDRRAHQRQRLQGVPRGDARAGDWDDCVEIARSRPATARTCSTSASTTSAATAPPTWTRWPAGSPPRRTLPLVLDSTEPPVLEAGLEHARRPGRPQLGQLRGRRRTRSRASHRMMPLVREHGAAVVALTIDEEGQARTAERKVADRRAADRRPHRRTWGMRVERHHRRLPDLPDRHRAGGDPPRRHRDDRGDPRAQAPLPGRADHARACRTSRFGLNPAARARAQLGVPARVPSRPGSTRRSCTRRKILPMHRIPDEQREVALDLVYDRARATGYDPLHARSWSCSRASTPAARRPTAPRSWPRCR